MKVLALQLKRIGDLVLTTPALHALKAAGAHVTLAHTEGTAALLPALTDCVDESLMYRPHGMNAPVWRTLLRGGFDACIDFTGRDRSALMALASRAPRRIIARQSLRKGRWRRLVFNSIVDTSVRGRHTIDLYLDHLAPLNLPLTALANLAPPLRVPVADATRAEHLLDVAGLPPGAGFAIVHPGSARAEKYWLPARWAEVIRFLQRDRGLRCVLTGGNDPFEVAHIAAIRAALSEDDQPIDLAGRADLLTLLALMARAALFVGVDSGPMHLASAFALPQIVLFGPTNPFHWRPRHAQTFVLQSGHGDAPVTDFAERSQAGPMDAISTQAVIACIKRLPL